LQEAAFRCVRSNLEGIAISKIFEVLAASEGFPRISIFLPTHPVYPECEQDPIRLANALREVRQQLVEAGWRSSEIEKLTAEAAARGKTHPFWRYQDEGLAVFIEPNATRWVKLPAAADDLTVVAARYHVRPLVRLLREPSLFHVLTVSQDGARFFNGTLDGLREVRIDGLPEGVAEIRGQTKFEANVGYHTRDRGAQVGGSDAPKYGALGESPEDYEDILLDHYIRDVAKAIDAHLASSSAPLVLVALARTLGRLKSRLGYAGVVDNAIAQDPKSIKDPELQKRALQIASSVVPADRAQVGARLEAAANKGSAAFSNDLEDILRAAEDGRVETVFVSPNQVVWGRYDSVHRVMRIDHNPGPENEDLLNLAALRTLARGGDVRNLPDEIHGPVAALYRF
jgi:Bacterial archaeo-eukaryotic release factor family 3